MPTEATLHPNMQPNSERMFSGTVQAETPKVSQSVAPRMLSSAYQVAEISRKCEEVRVGARDPESGD